MYSWEEISQHGFTTLDAQRKIAVKATAGNEDVVDLIKNILTHSYIDYLMKKGKDED